MNMIQHAKNQVAELTRRAYEQAAAEGLVKSGDPGDAVLELGVGVHARILKHKTVDTRGSGF